MSKLWIVVADSSRAKIFTADTLRGAWTQVEERAHLHSRSKVHDLVTDRAGYTEHTGQYPSGVGEDSNPKEEEHVHFAVELAHHLEETATRGGFERCVLIAPPRFLGTLRKHLGPTTTRRVEHTLARDLTTATHAEIARSLTADFERAP